MVDLRATSFGDMLKTARRRRRFTQGQLAARVGVHLNTLGAWERGDYLPTTRGLVLELAQHLQLEEAETRQLLEASLTGLSPHWTVPYPRNPFFTGREDLLERLHALLSPKQPGVPPRSYALSGLGGIGKTQLALEYAYRHALDYSAIFWLAAETPDTLLASLQRIAEVFTLREWRDAEQQRVVLTVQHWLNTHRGWLLVADNVEDLDLLQSVLPSTRQGAILLTTRSQALSTLAEVLEVPPMSREEGAALLLRRAKHLRVMPSQDRQPILAQATPADTALAADLVTALDGLPLALDQAGAYLEETGCSIADYLQRYAQNRVPLLARRGTAAGAHPTSASATLLLAVEQVQQAHQAASELLWLCSLLHPEAIPEELLDAGTPHLGPVLSPVVSDPLEFDLVLAALRRFSLVTRHPETHTLSLHRLVQAVLRDQMDAATTRLWSERAIQVVNAAFPAVSFATWAQAERCLPHALACLALLEPGGHVPSEADELFYKTGRYLLERGRYREAEPLLVQAVALEEARQERDQASVVPLLMQLGVLWKRQARYNQAAAILQRALSLGEQYLGPSHPQTARTLGEMADLWWLQGNYALAAQFAQQALTLMEQARGPEHPETALILTNLSICWREQGRYAEAEAVCRRALAIFERQLGPTHPDTAETLDVLGMLLLDQGNTEQAAQMFEQVLELREQHLGPEHPLTALSLNNLALAYYKQGTYNEAARIFRQALAIDEQQFGPDHPQTALGLHNLATVYRAQGRFAEALPLYARALTIDEQQLGPDHPMLAFPLNQLALLFCAIGEYEQAEVNGRRALSLRNAQLGEHHPLTAKSRTTLATIYRAQGKEAEAQTLSCAAVMGKHPSGPDHATLQGCSVLDGSSEHLPQQACSVLDNALETRAAHTSGQGFALVTAFSGMIDRRSAQGQRHPIAAVLALLTAALLSDAKTLRAVARWGRGQSPEVVRALGFRGASTPALSTLHATLKTLEQRTFEEALESWAQRVLGNEREALVKQSQQLVEGIYEGGLPGAQMIAGYPPETRQVLLERGLCCPDVGPDHQGDPERRPVLTAPRTRSF